MIPYKDDNPTSTFPFVTIAIIVANSALFLFMLMSDANRVVNSFGAIPASLLSLNTVQPIHPLFTVMTSMFIHGGLFHLGGNMLYLWIFGNNIEDRLGHFRFTVFYVLCGFFAAYSHAIVEPHSQLPMIGASGAVSGVLGAYILLYPKARVYTLLFLGFFIQVVKLPALIVIGFWAIIQLASGLLEKGLSGQGGVAWFAHIGGFISGMILVKIMASRRRLKIW